jgi:RimJ/RimL family protein N-acetyltransferase
MKTFYYHINGGRNNMIFKKELHFVYKGETCCVKSIIPSDITENYIEGLKRQRKYIQNNPENINIEWQSDYIRKINDSEQDTILGLFYNNVFIGTAGIQNIDKKGRTTIGIFIFNNSYRNMGLGKVLVWSSCKLLNNEFGISEFYAGMKDDNIVSYKSFISVGFSKSDYSMNVIKVQLNINDLITSPEISNMNIV